MACRWTLGHDELLALLQAEAVYGELRYESERVWRVSCFDYEREADE